MKTGQREKKGARAMRTRNAVTTERKCGHGRSKTHKTHQIADVLGLVLVESPAVSQQV